MMLRRGCPGCGGPSHLPNLMVGDRGPAICPTCLGRARPVGEIRRFPGLDRCGALYQYRDQVQRALLAGKYGARRDGLRQFGTMLGNLAEELRFEFDAVTWVPASRSGSRQRGYDQGRLLATALGRRVGAPVQRLLGPGPRDCGVGPGARGAGPQGPGTRLGRHGGQTGRGRRERLSGPPVRAVRRSTGRLLVVDDVITTGASITAAATVLREAGAAAVSGLAVAWTASDSEVLAGRPLPGIHPSAGRDRR